MATDILNTLNFTFVRRPAPKSGPSSSDAWNDSFTELANDLATITFEWNNKLVPSFEGLPDGVLDTSVNVYRNGIDGKNVWVDQNAVSTDDDLTYFDQVKNRPTTIHESFQDLYTHISSQISQVREDVEDTTAALTTDEKNRIGANVFDNSQTSSSLSLDGKSENNRLNVIQLAADMYGSGYALGNDGNPDLANSVRDMVNALLVLHNGAWDNDITLNHSGSFTATQADINTSSPGNDAYGGSPADLEDDLNQIRTQIRNAKGTGSWLSSQSSLYSGGADSLEDLLSSTSGSAAKSAANPWGYSYADVDGLTARLDAVRDFTGQDSHTDSSPTYASTAYVTSGDDLETAIGDLDLAVSNVNTLVATTAATQSGVDLAQDSALDSLRGFVGQNNPAETSPTFSSTQLVSPGASLEVAIGELDEATSTYIDSQQFQADLFLLPGSGVATSLTVHPTFITLSGIYSNDVSNGFSHNGAQLTYNGATAALFKVDMQLSTDASAADDYYFRITQAGVAVAKTECLQSIGGTGDFNSVSATSLLMLQPGDTIEVGAAVAVGAASVTPASLQLTVTLA